MIKLRYVLLLPLWAYICLAHTLGVWWPNEVRLAWGVDRVGMPRHIPYYEAYLPSLDGKAAFFPSLPPINLEAAENMAQGQLTKRTSQATIGDNRQYQSHLIQVREQIHITLPNSMTKSIKRLGDGVHFLHLTDEYRFKSIDIKTAMASANYLKADIQNGQIVSLVKKPLISQKKREYEYWFNGNIRYITENTLDGNGKLLLQQVTAFTRNGKNLYTLQTNQQGQEVFKTQYIHDSSDLFAKTQWSDADGRSVRQLTWQKKQVFYHQYWDEHGQKTKSNPIDLERLRPVPLPEASPYIWLQTDWQQQQRVSQ